MCIIATRSPAQVENTAALNNWLSPKFGADTRLDVDRYAIPALSMVSLVHLSRFGACLKLGRKFHGLGVANLDVFSLTH